MDLSRAKEIYNSPEMIRVTYNGVPVYIESINERNGIAYIHPIDNPEKKEQVSIQNLKEEG